MVNRISCIDVTKGIAIILMVIGHSSLPESFSNFIYAFHMPVFFILSGYCSNWHSGDFYDFIIKRIKSLIIPYIIYSIVVYAILGLIEIPIFSLKNGWGGMALWFVPVLFCSSVLARIYFMINILWIRILYIILCISIGLILSSNGVVLPWSVSSMPYAVFLIIIGTYLKPLGNEIFKPRMGITLLAALMVFLISQFYRLDMAWNKITPGGMLTFNAVLGSLMLMNLSAILEYKIPSVADLFSKIGKDTYVILAFSQITIICINKYLIINWIFKYLLLIVILFSLIKIKRIIIRYYNNNSSLIL